jgi:AcrR family transcriptional regulator
VSNPDGPTRAQRIQAASARRREERRLETRQAILAAAETLFAEHGYEGFSLRQVAEQAGYSATTIYLYFKDKDELLFEVALEGFDRFGQALQEAYGEAAAPLERLGAIGRAYVAFGLEYPLHYGLMFMQRGEFMQKLHPGEQKPLIESAGFRVLSDAVGEALEAGALGPAEPVAVATLLWSGVHGVVSLAISMPFLDAEWARRTAEAYFMMMLEGLQRS